MTSSAIKSKNSGFTIIELMIVLAIAGLILGMVLIAIPTLERNSRNNQRKQDVSTVLAAISRWGLNNSGAFPNDSDKNNVLTSSFKLYYYSGTQQPATDPNNQVQFNARTHSETTTQGKVVDIDIVRVYNYAKCDPNNSGEVIIRGAGYDNVVALFAIESGRDNITSRCQQL